MVDFRTLIQEVINTKGKWYHEKVVRKNMCYIWDESLCQEFIRKYMESAGTTQEPESLVEILSMSNNRTINPNRYQHILMTYFFGLAIYNNCSIIKKAVDEGFCQNSKYECALEKHVGEEFSYLWFLICLFHDLGYQYENDFKKAEKMFPDFSTLNSQTIFDNTSILEIIDGVPDLYKNVVENYFNLRRCEHNVYDHGIVGGMQLYHDLCEIRQKKHDALQNKEAVNKGFWKEELNQIFAYAASVVLCHNIFFASNDKDVEMYKNYQLEPLINTKREYRVILSKYPVFFLFCLVDALEPIKIVKDVNYLDKISYRFTDDSIEYFNKLTCGCHDRLNDKVRDLQNWLCPLKEHNGKFVIGFKEYMPNN